MLQLVSSNKGVLPSCMMSPQRAQYEMQRLGTIVQLGRGIYCHDDDLQDLPEFMRKNAIRIANYLYRGCTLTHSSAYFKGAVRTQDSTDERPKYKLFIAGSYNHKVSVDKRGLLEIVQSDAMSHGRIGQFNRGYSDGQDKEFGPMYLGCLSEEVVFLQQFGRRRYNLERFLAPQHLDELLGVLTARHGDALAGRLRTVADEVSGFAAELTGALAYLRGQHNTQRLGVSANPGQWKSGANGATSYGNGDDEMNTVFEFDLGWYGRPIGKISNNGVSWSFNFNEGWLLPLSVGTNRPGVMPFFIQNLFPQGYLVDAMNDALGDERGQGNTVNIMRQSERYLSNLSIVSNPERLKEIPLDVLEGRLKDHVDGRAVFLGGFRDMPNTSKEAVAELNKVLVDMRISRLSGNQAKIPCFLDSEGQLMPALDKSFTHILKLAGLRRDPHGLMGAVEWATMSLARGGGLKTCDFALVDLPGSYLGYVCERFDIPESAEDMRMLYAEDLCSVFSHGPNYMYDAENGIEDMGHAVTKFCSPTGANKDHMFRMIFANYVLENSDFHLKNASLLRVASPTLDDFRVTNVAPAYDIMNTRYFANVPRPPQVRETMCLAFRNKGGNWSKEDFYAIADTMQLSPERAEQIMRSTALGIAQTAREMAADLPPVLDTHPKARQVIEDVLQRAVLCCNQEYKDIPLLEIAKKAGPAEEAADADENPDEPEMLKEVRRMLRP